MPAACHAAPPVRPPARPARRRRLPALLAALLLSGCVVVPRSVPVYDADCQITHRQWVLDVQQIGSFAGCHNEGCIGVLVALGAVASVSAVISGSVVVVGNVVYWFEKRSQCRESPRPPR
ncbi:MAG: hypothetical protein L6Q75_06030 [Burkholderiaceae bacterium]|nr:hypothetical protein [Burkholderiaceae bacterium]